MVDDGVQADTPRADRHKRAPHLTMPRINPDHASVWRARIRPHAVNRHVRRAAEHRHPERRGGGGRPRERRDHLQLQRAHTAVRHSGPVVVLGNGSRLERGGLAKHLELRDKGLEELVVSREGEVACERLAGGSSATNPAKQNTATILCDLICIRAERAGHRQAAVVVVANCSGRRARTHTDRERIDITAECKARAEAGAIHYRP